MEKYLHNQIMHKKLKIFNQQKHRTKKSLLTEAKYYGKDAQGKLYIGRLQVNRLILL